MTSTKRNGQALKILSEFKGKIKPKNLEENDNVRGSHITSFATRLNSVINSQLINPLDVEINKLSTSIGDVNRNLQQQLKSLQEKVDDLNVTKVVNPSNDDEWEAPTYPDMF